MRNTESEGVLSSVRERERNWSEKEGGKERIVIFFKGMTGALAPFSYLVENNIKSRLTKILIDFGLSFLSTSHFMNYHKT